MVTRRSFVRAALAMPVACVGEPDGSALMPLPTARGGGLGVFGKVMPLGDSITRGESGSDLAGWRSGLAKLAIAAGRTIDFVGSAAHGPTQVTVSSATYKFDSSHQGHNGYYIKETSPGAGNGIYEIVAARLNTYTPDVVLLHIGTNNVWPGGSNTTAIADLPDLLDLIIATRPQARLFVAQIIPATGGISTNIIPEYNTAIASMVSTRAAAGKLIYAVDHYTSFMSGGSPIGAYFSDQVHPSDAGHAVMAQNWATALGL